MWEPSVCLIFLSALATSRAEISKDLELDYETASRLAGLPLHCATIEYPNKLSQVLQNETELLSPSELHPIFYGCFDWHSSVHGHWLLAKVGNLFPATELHQNVSTLFAQQFTQEKVDVELSYFKRKWGKSFERTYGWAWLLKLQEELQSSNQEDFQEYARILKPLADHITELYIDFLPRLSYPVRVGEHTNTAFGLVFALDYAKLDGNEKLVEAIRNVSLTFYSPDVDCPLRYEPSGYDFLSPCLQEAEIMSKIIEDNFEYEVWLQKFLNQLYRDDFSLEPGKVADRTDGKLVHLDGLNFSRAWALYTITSKLRDEDMVARLNGIADEHILTSMDNVVGSDYAGSHWLASFLFHALEVRNQAK
eukprot:TRINITY_DN9969_c0_g1_i1.p1 TRINITY_DN9969_c0_g1~~TRINITY_DN9969_c0_g1_i1.p1  ORF type:complete len:364 (+),score=35.35 TRINITY_DN9969_c0_g1_i1:32-1123(+)